MNNRGSCVVSRDNSQSLRSSSSLLSYCAIVFDASRCSFALFFKLRVYRKQALYLYEVGFRSAYTVPFPDLTCEITHGLLLLLLQGVFCCCLSFSKYGH